MNFIHVCIALLLLGSAVLLGGAALMSEPAPAEAGCEQC